ncbi:CeGAL family transcription factor [Aspergillus affinis]|uniref:CeGAL family transcription factor n=1 Tax=Aspergillus affinis TaxID=1070780 RepID=UPI0022FF17B0|nr:uncharacterized protein KD926_006106 [Aspergillus affinis]KAI9042187.1 hypothetical protein KD926_006106 [Aspergillus affinis]
MTIVSQRQMNSLEAKIGTYEKALKIVGDWNGLSSEELVNLALSEETSSNKDAYTNPTRSSGTSTASSKKLITGPSRVLDYTAVDYNFDDASRSTGYIGRSSEIYWMHALNKMINSSKKTKGDSNASSASTLGPHGDGRAIASFNYNLDHLEITTTERVEQISVPPKAVCWHLFELYRSSVHPLFPIIGLVPFTRQLESFLDKPMQPGSRWLAILHLIIAIAARYNYVTNRQWRYDQVDHFSHFLKVKTLNIDNQVLSHPDMQQLQVEGLASFYLLSMGYVNRFVYISLKTTHVEWISDSCPIGSSGPGSSAAVHYAERLPLGYIYATVPDNILTTPLLLPFDESDFPKEEVQRLLARSAPSPSQLAPVIGTSKSTTSGETKQDATSDCSHAPPSCSLYFTQLVKLTIIAKKMSIKLYNPESVPSLWSGIKYAMHDLIHELEAWLMNLPKFYDFSSPTNTSSLATERMTLALLFYSTKLAITRPCLGPSDPEQKGQNDREFTKKNAVDCVESACHVIRLLPEPADTDALYTLFPWWSIIHFLMQATAVLFIEASLNFEHIPQKVPMVLRAVKKSLEWMSVMSTTSTTAARARKVCEHFLERLGIELDSEDSNPSKPESDSNDSPPIQENFSNPPPKRVKFQDPAAESDPPLMLHTYHSNFSASAHTMGAPGTAAVPNMMESHKPTPYAFADELLPYDQNTGVYTDSIFPPVDPTLESNLSYPPDLTL